MYTPDPKPLLVVLDDEGARNSLLGVDRAHDDFGAEDVACELNKYGNPIVQSIKQAAELHRAQPVAGGVVALQTARLLSRQISRKATRAVARLARPQALAQNRRLWLASD